VQNLDATDATDDAKFSDVPHNAIPSYVVADALFRGGTPDAGKLKNGGSACGNRRRAAPVFCLGRRPNPH
ncbi:MAG: hypothetical protein VX218_16590, partial [Pseudomonadota bacterium]|nr:hypothetical protein [Pseudomonadota bacterium]